MEILAKNLIALRAERKWTRKVVSEKIGIAERTYQRYENAEREPAASVLVALASALVSMVINGMFFSP